MRKHFHDLKCYLASLKFNFDVVALSETWLGNKDDLQTCILDNYHPPIFLNRPSASGGGVALYVIHQYIFKLRDDWIYNSNETQIIFAELERKKGKTIVGVTYKPPHTGIDDYSSCLLSILDNLDKNKCFLAGDFNIDLLKSDNHDETSLFFNDLLSYSYFPSIIKSTRLTDSSATLIDNIFTNALDIVDSLHSLVYYVLTFPITCQYLSFIILPKLRKIIIKYLSVHIQNQAKKFF